MEGQQGQRSKDDRLPLINKGQEEPSPRIKKANSPGVRPESSTGTETTSAIQNPQLVAAALLQCSHAFFQVAYCTTNVHFEVY